MSLTMMNPCTLVDLIIFNQHAKFQIKQMKNGATNEKLVHYIYSRETLHVHSVRYTSSSKIIFCTLVELVIVKHHAKFQTKRIKNEKLANIYSREILHVHCARHGCASNLKLGTPIDLVKGYMPTKFEDDRSKNTATVIA